MSPTRQLAAIMFTDIEGYTRMMQEDETLTLQLRDKLQKKLEVEVSRHHGRLWEFKGDGALCSFSSTLEAVKAALAVQLEMQKTPLVPVRIGMHTGDVVLGENTIYGDSVNIASRIESFAQSGSILISGRVYDDIKNHKEIQTVPLGAYALKNVKEQAALFAVSNTGIKIPDINSLKGKGEKAQQKCLLVLPFTNMSNDPEQEYFSDGLTEELITSLTRLKDIKVISRTTSMRYKNIIKDIKKIGLETAASYIVEGSVRKSGSNLRITAQFIDAARDIHLWAENYSGTMDDIFDMQEKVSAKIVEALRLHLTGDDKDKLQKRYTDSIEAYQLYLKGRYFWKKRNEEGLKTALRFFEKAIDSDPDYALAWVGLADTYSLMGEYTNISRRELLPKSKAAIGRALEIDSRLAEAHISYAILLMMNDWDWVQSEKEFKLGIELDPNYPTGHHWYAEFLLFTGRVAEAFREISLAVDLDPLSQGILKDKGIFYYYNRQYDEAIEIAMTILELDPGFATAYRLLSLAYIGKGVYDEAIRENQRWGEHTGNKTKTDIALAQIYADAGRKNDAEKIIKDLEAKVLGGNDYRGMALIFTSLGKTDTAFEWLEKSYQMHEESLCSLKIDPKFDAIRSDPRFNILLAKLGLI